MNARLHPAAPDATTATGIATATASIPTADPPPGDRAAALFAAGRLGDIAIANRVVMAPLTRCRATQPGDVPGSDLNVAYYRQRASAGLIVSEGTQVAPLGKGYPDTPGLYSPEQVHGWRRITDAVHDAGGRIVAQIWHVGRISHPAVNGTGQPVAPSALRPRGTARTPQGRVELPEPRALATHEVAGVVDEFRRAAANALRAGFDGVEIHGANGYLVDQFLRDGTNRRDDDYGGPVAQRCRFALKVVDACAAEIGAGRVGIRLSPLTPASGDGDSDPQATFGHLVRELDRRRIAFVHLIEGVTGGPRDVAGFDFAAVRAAFRGGVVVNNGYTRDTAVDAVASGRADAVAFGRAFIANPDLVRRLRENAPLNVPDPATFYTPGEAGYTDYPALR